MNIMPDMRLIIFRIKQTSSVKSTLYIIQTFTEVNVKGWNNWWLTLNTTRLQNVKVETLTKGNDAMDVTSEHFLQQKPQKDIKIHFFVGR